jgi:hypothetical protein
MSEKRSSRKKVLSFVENILALVLMILAVFWFVNRLVFMMETRIGEWYNYTFVIGIGLLSMIVGLALVKGLLSLILVQRREKLPEEKH